MCPEPEVESTPRRSTIPLFGLILLAGILAFAATLGIWKVRHQSRKVACSNNLRQLGLAAQTYLNDPLKMIFEGGYVDDPEMLVCPVTGEPYRFPVDPKSDGDPSTDPILICRHRDGANVMFLQGNVKWVPTRELERTKILETKDP